MTFCRITLLNNIAKGLFGGNATIIFNLLYEANVYPQADPSKAEESEI